ncbi:MAG TPA: DUF362 domain-containing protein [Vicinamibacterales bacterium]|nr:DUF362 domain-containing protein [Vicinamibacterales bacterium]
MIVVQAARSEYPALAPFHPSAAYPEYELGPLSGEFNAVYEAVRSAFQLAGLDSARFGTADWNPLGGLIRRGETVLLKPNLIKERHPREPEGWRYVLTHGSIVRAVADYVYKALGSRGKIIIADAPQTDSSFDAVVRVLGLDVIRDFYQARGLDIELVDLRNEEWRNVGGVIVGRRRLKGDPRGAVAVDLGPYSAFVGHNGTGRYYGADYDEAEVNRHHSDGRHEYLIAGSAIRADVVISLPKLKTHKKAGITVALKNLVGITADKNWLPHHTEGSPEDGGDEHPRPDAKHRSERLLAAWLRRVVVRHPLLGFPLLLLGRRMGRFVYGDTESVIRSGNWWGNDTVWRMCLDLNTALLYANPDGSLRPPRLECRKRHYVLVDGIIGGQGRGPMNPDPAFCGIVVFGLNAPCVDAVCAYLMGFDPNKIPIIREAFHRRPYMLADLNWWDVCVISNRREWTGRLLDIPDESTFRFEPHFGWKGRIERLTASAPAMADA